VGVPPSRLWTGAPDERRLTTRAAHSGRTERTNVRTGHRKQALNPDAWAYVAERADHFREIEAELKKLHRKLDWFVTLVAEDSASPESWPRSTPGNPDPKRLCRAMAERIGNLREL